MANQMLLKQFQKGVAAWPKDVLRPHASFGSMLARRANENSKKTTTEAETNALFTLLEGRYARRYALSAASWRPASNPEYYDNLVRELREAPTRGWWARFANSWKGFLRLK